MEKNAMMKEAFTKEAVFVLKNLSLDELFYAREKTARRVIFLRKGSVPVKPPQTIVEENSARLVRIGVIMRARQQKIKMAANLELIYGLKS